MIAGDLYLIMLLLFSTGILSAFFTRRNVKYTNYIAHSIALMGCAMAILCAIFVFVQGEFKFTLPVLLPFGEMIIKVDGLSAFFLFVVGVVGVATSLYAYGYSREYEECRLPLMAGLYNAFLLSIVLVLTVQHVAAFIIAWELMSIVSFFLVNHEYEKKVNTRSAYIYILMTHIGTVFIITAFLLLAVAAGSMNFEHLSGNSVNAFMKNIVFICVLIGFGTKAGMVPLHIWLPRAHPAAPSHVSALMSGAMLKTAIYGMCRFFLDFLGIGPVWWGVVILVIASITAVLGVLYAFIEHDMKRLLAYSSVENIGIILLGMGAGMVFISSYEPVLAGLAFTAALYHVVNHALFKSLAFMGAGAVLQSAHTKNMEQLGGLIKRMPYTAGFFLVAAVAISALPPLNGFVSEWLTFQALLCLPLALTGIIGKVGSASLIALLGLTGALAAACFVQTFGITFLAKPRSKKAEEAVEAAPTMLIAMGLLAVLCILLGIWPQVMLLLLHKTLQTFSSLDVTMLGNQVWYQIPLAQRGAGEGISTALIGLILAGGGLLAYVLYRNWEREKISGSETWTCGIVPNPRMEYTATGFSKSIRLVFKNIVHSYDETLVNRSSSQYYGRELSYQVRIQYVFVSLVYRPINEGIIKTATFMKNIQTGSVQLYVGYIMFVTVVVLIWSTRW
ncbi:hydrogenase 4 subunit B [Pelosinus sp. IPA-1]|uniref:hydrogenase 4 subunit B n=1 Tax=Pelosinus sp. IPA-1 TaxID=3029569 RepID=UPI0024361999|nr:hydrogenase 4 subunit B [Pelosinus sp. IPA-1]GMB00767.1 hydrogenase 4 subunit B [Pelosinus sp. IPA-1]